MRLFCLTLLCAVTSGPLAAQIGHDPRRSPYLDLEARQEVTLFGGFYNAALDPARVAPGDGPMIGAHYEIRMAGPAYFTARIAGSVADRRVIDPKLELSKRFLRNKSTPLLFTDVGFALNLTGFKSWHGLIPVLGAGVGSAAGFDKLDEGKYRFGYPFLISVRPGIKFAARGKWHGRVDATNYFHRVRYPETYFTKTGADDTVLPPDAERSYWKRNLAITLGATYTYGR